MRIVIVGGVAAGITAATRVKRLMEDADVVVYERGERISFANCALPYYAGGVVRPEGLYAASAARLEAMYAIEIRERHEVLSINREAKTLRVKNLETNEIFETPYDRLILATGAAARILPIEGLRENAHPLWRPEDALRLEEKLSKTPGCRVGIVGGGAVGLETAENVIRRGGVVHLMEYGRTIMGRNDEGLSNAFIRLAESKAKNLHIHTNTSVVKVEKRDDGTFKLTLSTGDALIVDDVISAAGVMPRVDLAREAGLALGPRDTILTDAFMRTSDPSIFAAGDVATSLDPVSGAMRPMMLAGTAAKEGRKAADALAGFAKTPMAGGFATNGISLFGTLWASTGKSEQALINEGRTPHKDFFRATVIGRNHVAWYPGSVELVLKVLFDAEGRVLGAQAIGREGADKRIDVVSTAMRFKATVHDLAELDLCYCPQTGTPKDAVNTAGHIAENILSGLVRFIEPQELRAVMAGNAPYLGEGADFSGGVTLLDVREPAEIAEDALPWPLLDIPLGELRERIDEIPEGNPVVVVCRSAVRAYAAARALAGRRPAQPVYVLTGGMRYWHLTAPREA